MKTSNKILLGAFVTAMLLVFSLHATIYIKFKNGNYTLNKLHPMYPDNYTLIDDGSPREIHQLKAIKYVFLGDVSVQLFNSDNQSIHLIQKKEKKYEQVKFEQRGDSLFVFVPERDKSDLSAPTIKLTPQLYINKDVVVHGKRADISLQNEKDSIAAPSFKLNLDSSSVSLITTSNNGNTYFKSLKIGGKNNSDVSLRYTTVALADISLEHSNLSLHETQIGDLKLKSDKSSRFFISPK